MRNDDVLRQTPGVACAEIGDEIVFMHEGEGSYFSLDNVGAFIWRAIAQPRTVAELVEMVTREYDVPEEQFRADLDQLIPDLVRLELVRHQTVS